MTVQTQKNDELLRLLRDIELTITDLHGFAKCVHLLSAQCDEYLENALFSVARAAIERCEHLEDFHDRAHTLAFGMADTASHANNNQENGPVGIAVPPSLYPTNPEKE